MDFDTTVKVISQLGFPIAVCVWFMWRDAKFISILSQRLDKVILLLELSLKQTIITKD